VVNGYGQAVSQPATLAVGSGILITQQPVTQYVDAGSNATFQVTATSSLPLTYQWYEAPPGSSTFTAIAGATSSTYTLDSAATADSGSVFYVVVSNGTTSSVTSASAGLFVGALSGIPPCDNNWSPIGTAMAESGCSFQLTTSTNDQDGAIVWPNLISTGDIQLSFNMTLSNPSAVPADGFTITFGDPSLGATPTSLGAQGMGLGAKGIPGVVFGFDTYHNAGEYPVPYAAVGRGEAPQFETPWFSVDTSIPTLVADGMTISHDYTITIVQGQVTVALDGVQVISGNVTLPPVAYLYVTASTGGSYETAVVSNPQATVTVPSD
jgi:Bacterial lectin